MTSPIQCILFDLDGTLIDTEPSAALAVKECFSQWKITLAPSDATFVTGRTWESAFQFLFDRYSLPLPQETAKKEILDRYRSLIESDLHIVPGSPEAVRQLASRYPMGLVSGSGRREILWALDKLEIRKHFQIVLGAEDYPQSKPQPDGYLKAMKHLGFQPQECLVFEDSTAGIQSARTAGMWIVAVTSTNHFQQDVSLAHHRIRDLREVTPKWVETLSFI